MAITTKDGLIAALAGSQKYTFQRSSLGNTAAGQLLSVWRSNGAPMQGAIPGAAATCTSSLTGAVPFVNPVSPSLSYLGELTLQAANAGSVIVFDRLAHMGGLSGAVATSQAVNIALPSNRGVRADYANVEWYLEWYADTGSTSVTATVNYTNQGGTTGRTTTVTLAATTRAGRMMFITPPAGEAIKSIESVTLSVSTGTAGSFGVTACIRVAEIPVASAALVTVLDSFNLGLPQVFDNSCLALAVLCSAATTGLIQGRLLIAQG